MDFEKKSVLSAFKQSLETTSTCLITNWEETNQIEFKKSLHTVNETINKSYLPTVSGYANNIGGIIVFGILPTTKELAGIKEVHENLDNRFVSSTVRNVLDGDINFEFFTERYLGKIVGFLVVKEARSKPIIFKADAGEAKLGEIYFRYPGLTSKIGAGELRRILLEEITSKTQRIIESFQKIVDAGNENIAILNTKTGEIESTEHNIKLSLNENILNRLNLIKNGEIVNEGGAPAYIIKGEIEVESSTYVEKPVPFLLSEKDVFKFFLTEECDHPLYVIDYIMTLHSFLSPIYFFLKTANMNIQEGKLYINNVKNSNAIDHTKSKIIERLNGTHAYQVNGKLLDNLLDIIDVSITIEETVSRIKQNLETKRQVDDMQIIRKLIFNTLISHTPIPADIYKNNLQRSIEAFSNLKKSHVTRNRAFYKAELSKISDLQMDNAIVTNFRRVMCMIDDYLHREEI